MTRSMAIVLCVCTLIGCRAPAPSWNFLAPYGSPTVPPPRTGAVGTGGTYYAPTTPDPQAPAVNGAISAPGAGVMPPAAGGVVPPAPPSVSFSDAANDAISRDDREVAAASYEPGSTHGSDTLTRITDDVPLPASSARAGESSSTLQLDGMRVSDATKLDEPQQFRPAGEPTNIASLPNAESNAPAFLRFINPKPGNTAPTGTPTPAVPPPSGAWQSR